MQLIEQLKNMSARIPQQVEFIQTEEATKMTLVLPFLQALGYNVFDPREVVPEYTADVGTKKGEKVDYAIVQEGKVLMLIECKPVGGKLTVEHASQLYRYFSVVDARLAVLTDGVIYKFFSDIDSPNKMDDKPFLELDMLNLDEHVLTELKAITKGNFNVDGMLAAASDLRYTREVKAIFARQLNEPDEEFARYFIAQFYQERITPAVRARFTPVIKKALNQFISERVTGRLTAALAQENSEAIVVAPSTPSAATSAQALATPPSDNHKPEIVTTQDELDAYWAIKAIMREALDPGRIHMRDAKSYCAIIFDDNNRKPLARLYFNTANKQVGIFDKDKNEEKMPLERIDDLFQFADRLKATALAYAGAAEEAPSAADSTPAP
jgi:predicted type IV restriction endonuclease